MRVYRTLLIKYPLKKLKEEERNAIIRLLLRLDALGNLYARGYEIEPPDLPRTLINSFKFFKTDLKFGTRPKRWFCRVHPIVPVGIRVYNERDNGESLFIDLPARVLRLRRFMPRRAIIIPLYDSVIKYIKERLNEGAKAKCAYIWLDKDKLCIGIVFEREIEPRQSYNGLLVIDVNSWKHGSVWALIKDNRIASRGVERPNLRYIDCLYYQIFIIEKKLGALRRLGLKYTKGYYRLRRQSKSCKSKIYRYLKDYVNKLVHKLIRKALRHSAKIIIDNTYEESRRDLLEEKLDNGLTKVYLLYLPRFVKLLENQAKWYGIPIEFRRLPSTLCPRCNNILREIEPRVMLCEKCGFKANRDDVPIYHILREAKSSTN